MDPLVLIIFFSLLIVCFFCIIFSTHYLLVRKYEYKSEKVTDEFDGVKILHISDLHSKRFGEGNKKLISKIQKINPDYIFMTGDIIDKREVDVEKFVEELKPIFNNYTVYYSIGNHEKALGYNRYIKYLKCLEKNGVNVLNDESRYVDIDESINIVGLNFKDNMRYEENKSEDIEVDKYLTYLRGKSGQIDFNKLNILLSHDPLNFKLYNKLGFDLIFSGHVHGGIIRFFKIGLLSPRRKLFPKYCYGKYVMENSTMFVSSGIGKATIPIRLFNNPEISIITLKKKVDDKCE